MMWGGGPGEGMCGKHALFREDSLRWGGQWEEGITGTTMEDTWTKSRGRVEVGEGGGFSWGEVEG